jgi:hypothetical protein
MMSKKERMKRSDSATPYGECTFLPSRPILSLFFVSAPFFPVSVAASHSSSSSSGVSWSSPHWVSRWQQLQR